LHLHVTVKWRYVSNEQTTDAQQLAARMIKNTLKTFMGKLYGKASSKTGKIHLKTNYKYFAL
jgi:RNase P/RNase MRP subunit POP5